MAGSDALPPGTAESVPLPCGRSATLLFLHCWGATTGSPLDFLETSLHAGLVAAPTPQEHAYWQDLAKNAQAFALMVAGHIPASPLALVFAPSYRAMHRPYWAALCKALDPVRAAPIALLKSRNGPTTRAGIPPSAAEARSAASALARIIRVPWREPGKTPAETAMRPFEERAPSDALEQCERAAINCGVVLVDDVYAGGVTASAVVEALDVPRDAKVWVAVPLKYPRRNASSLPHVVNA